jgi:hypothetical protein
VFKS